MIGRSWTGVRLSWGDCGLSCSSRWDMATNGGFNNYEERLHVIRLGPLQIRWYTLT